MTADLSALIARLEAGPVYLTHKEAYDLAIFFGSDTALGMASLIRKAFTGGSLDAALALAERVLPPMPWTVSRFHRDRAAEYQAALWMDPDSDPAGKGRGSTPALALCIAILKARQSD